jgi:acetyl-CoA carboxylase carboxyltransferase component
MTHEFLAAIVTSLVSSTGGWGILQFFLARKQDKREKVRDKQAEDSQTWYRQSKHHYETAVSETVQAKQECADCRKELRDTRNVIYALLEDLEDQIIPMLGLPGADLVATRRAMREAVHKAREAL